MEQLYIANQPVWYGDVRGGFGNNNGYKIAVGPRPEDSILRQAGTTWSQETAVTCCWTPCMASFFDTPGRRQILFQAALGGFKSLGLYTGDLSATVSESLFRYSDPEKKRVIRRKLEDRLRKDENFLTMVIVRLAEDLL